jgi:hypothetical protein
MRSVHRRVWFTGVGQVGVSYTCPGSEGQCEAFDAPFVADGTTYGDTTQCTYDPGPPHR